MFARHVHWIPPLSIILGSNVEISSRNEYFQHAQWNTIDFAIKDSLHYVNQVTALKLDRILNVLPIRTCLYDH